MDTLRHPLLCCFERAVLFSPPVLFCRHCAHTETIVVPRADRGGSSPPPVFQLPAGDSRSLSSAATLVPFILALELGTLHHIAVTFSAEHGAKVCPAKQETLVAGGCAFARKSYRCLCKFCLSAGQGADCDQGPYTTSSRCLHSSTSRVGTIEVQR